MEMKRKLDILYEDKDLLIVNKRSNYLSVSTNQEKNNTLFHEVFTYIKSKNKNNKIFIVNRLDKDTSGIVVFAKNEKVKKLVQNNWDKVVRKYHAVVLGKLSKKTDTIKSYLKETKSLFVYSSNDSKNGKLAITDYEVIKENSNYSLLLIDIKTGRKNQIRVHLSDLGHPIVGDKKYGNKCNFTRMYLHASYINLVHPITKKRIEIQSNYPNSFDAFF